MLLASRTTGIGIGRLAFWALWTVFGAGACLGEAGDGGLLVGAAEGAVAGVGQVVVAGEVGGGVAEAGGVSLVFCVPFVLMLGCIAVFPLLGPVSSGWWHINRNKLAVSLFLGVLTMFYYLWRETPFHGHTGTAAVAMIIEHALLVEYIPFVVLLFSLYTISGGIKASNDIRALPRVNVVILGVGAVLSNLIGTTGASMLLIRPLLQINRQRSRRVHTVVFFIFVVSNCGGCLTPVADPPLYLGFIKGVPFFWTLETLWPMWLVTVGSLLGVYYVWDRLEYGRERRSALAADSRSFVPFKLMGWHNLGFLALLAGIVASVDPDHALPLVGVRPPIYVRELLMLGVVWLSWVTTRRGIRRSNDFSFGAIGEVACVFLGIFLTMQVPLEWLAAHGAGLGVEQPWQYFWTAGLLSSFLDNAPTYLVFLALGEAGAASGEVGRAGLVMLGDGRSMVDGGVLAAVSVGSVFFGAMTYIGNAPNFMVKSIAEQAGVQMPGFAKYMGYSVLVLVPLFALVTWLFLV